MSLAYSVKTADGAVKAGPGILYSFTLTGGSDAATLTIYDSLAGSGTQMWARFSVAANETVTAHVPGGIAFGVGCFAVLTGTDEEASFAYI